MTRAELEAELEHAKEHHARLHARLDKLSNQLSLTPQEQVARKRLKKLKLQAKDNMARLEAALKAAS